MEDLFQLASGLFYLIPALIMAVALAVGWTVVRRWLRLRAAWSSGLTAEARCLRVYTTTHGGGDTSVHTELHHVYEFTARDGRVIRFEEQGGPGTTLEGDFVTVRYTQGARVSATALAPRRGLAAAGTFGVLAFVGVIVLFCVGFMVASATLFSLPL
ncbi:hypothetical protein [Streptomyces sp. enrichment culture]|uniref:hypothetical protein n=1 Tax=Streptomyces sp. enrichment culture TaxID=1795815 RepID=UPI003F55FAB4